MSTAEIMQQARKARRARVALARQDPNTFAELVLKDERSGTGLRQAPIHEAWHDLAAKHDRLVLWSHIESGKTTQMSIARVLWEIGRDPSIRIAVISNTHGQAEKIVRTVGSYIENSPELHEVFPGLKPGQPWTSTKLTVERSVQSKDPTVQAFGVHGSVIGARLDLVVLDDILDPENCRTPKSRQDLMDWYHAAVAGRLTAQARVIVIGTAYHPDDALHRFARMPGWAAYRYPILENGQSRWPERWPMDRIAKKQIELGTLEFSRQLMCEARDDSTARFQQAWVNRCLAAGDGLKLTHSITALPLGCSMYTGVDLAVQQHSSADLTVFFTILVTPDGKRYVQNVESGRWVGPQIVERIIDAHRRYQSIIVVENNAAQDFILQFTRDRSAVPMKAFTTGRNKADPTFGIESMATEMENGKWVIPNTGSRCVPELQAWLNEMLYYDPRGHTGDRLMASWFAREGARMGKMTAKAETGRIDLLSR